MSFISILEDTKAEIEKEKFQYLKTVKLKISRGRKSQLVVSHQVMTNQWCQKSSLVFTDIQEKLLRLVLT